jgi:hypothetical protein
MSRYIDASKFFAKLQTNRTQRAHAYVPPFLWSAAKLKQRKGRGIRVGNCLPSFYEPDGNVFTPRLMG